MALKARLSSLFRTNTDTTTRAHPLIDAARHAKFSGNHALALETLDRALTEFTGDPALVQLQRAEVLTNAGRYDEAAAAVEAARRSLNPPTRAYALCAAGRLAQVQGDWAAARDDYERALEIAREARAVSAEGRAMSHLADVYLNDGNASYAAHLLREALPKLHDSTDVEMSSYFVGRLGQALIQSGQEVEGYHLIGRALALAEQIGYRRYLRRWSIVMGERAAAEARYLDATTHFERALTLFQRETSEKVYTLSQISKAHLALHEHEQALAAAQKAVEAGEKLQETKSLLLARGALGAALRAAGRSGEAVPHLEAAAAGLDQVDSLRALAAAQTDSGDLDAAVATYQQAIERAEATSAPLELAGARRDLGLVYLKREQLLAAIQAWTAALAVYEAHNAHAQTARLYCDIGNARKMLGQVARAMKDYEQALMTLNSVEEYDTETRGLVLSSAANAYAEQGDVESADAFYSEAISIAVRSGDQTAESIRSGNYGYFLLLVGRPRRAIASLERALRLSQSLGLTLHSAVQTDNLGLSYDALADYEVALGYHQKAVEMGEVLNQAYWLASFRINLANTYIALGQLTHAEPLIRLALEAGQANENSELVIRAQTAQALLAVHKGVPDAAEAPLYAAITLARRLEMRRWLAEALAVGSQQQASLGSDAEANAAWEEARHLYEILHMPQAKHTPVWLAREEVSNE